MKTVNTPVILFTIVFSFYLRLWGFMYFIEGGTGVKVAVLDACHLRSELPPHKVVVFKPDTYLF